MTELDQPCRVVDEKEFHNNHQMVQLDELAPGTFILYRDTFQLRNVCVHDATMRGQALARAFPGVGAETSPL
ncbi:hypothetical protein Y032_0167g151 [Ancylostoma ceylanicum]|uniref:Uncharacterized protein n=1 Tax=Ancylostoma ceylanicum TaxID=53326 RepID=A0A016SWN8_9BILA|nr:hypothetical protein Y032_0167g151 [Ancylostoma ceylanicum]